MKSTRAKRFMIIFVSCAVTAAFWANASQRRISPSSDSTSSSQSYPFYSLNQAGDLESSTISDTEARLYGFSSLTTNGQKIYFYNRKAFFKYKGFDRDLDKAVRYFAPYNSAVTQCLSNPSVKDGDSKSVRYDMRQLCRRPDLYYGSSAFYTIARRSGRIEIDLDIALDYQGRSENRNEVFRRVRAIEPCTEQFFARNGVKLNLNLTEGSSNSRGVVVKLWDYYDRDNASNWATMGHFGRQITTDEACAVVAHELGHLIGMPDRYIDQNCPDRAEKPTSERDVMGRITFDSYDTEYSNVDLADAISPLCEGRDPHFAMTVHSSGSGQNTSHYGRDDGIAQPDQSGANQQVDFGEIGSQVEEVGNRVWSWLKRQADSAPSQPSNGGIGDFNSNR